MELVITQYLMLKESKIHNKGVFARKDILPNIKLIEYTGRKITKEEADKIEKQSIKIAKKDKSKGKTYIFELNEIYDIDGDTQDNHAKFINHSCFPNAHYLYEDDHIWIVSSREIKKGEEITYNYGFDFEYNFRDHLCNCKAKNCVGYILDEEHWPKLKEALKK